MSVANRLIFPAPRPSYVAETYRRHLCWLPWNPDISPKLSSDPRVPNGIPCMWLPAQRAANVMLFLHGNAEDLGMSFTFVRHMRDQFKVNVLAVEYPGYGLLSGAEPSEEAVNEVALTVFRFLVDEMHVKYERIYIFGRSIGTGPAVQLASQFPIGGLILVSPFTSIKAAIEAIAGTLAALFFRERFPNSALISNVQCPTLFIHGEKDSLIPADHSLQLFKRCRARKLFITPPRMEHNSNLWADSQYLAVPAINFFGLPGFCTERPPKMHAAYFEGASSRRSTAAEGASPWFWFCGHPQRVERKTLEPITGEAPPADPADRPVGREKLGFGEWSFSDLSTGDAMSESAEKNGDSDTSNGERAAEKKSAEAPGTLSGELLL
jgi:pimeloyl-ACP methyl ester carboxylesterase